MYDLQDITKIQLFLGLQIIIVIRSDIVAEPSQNLTNNFITAMIRSWLKKYRKLQ